jgi:hypothetical protein
MLSKTTLIKTGIAILVISITASNIALYNTFNQMAAEMFQKQIIAMDGVPANTDPVFRSEVEKAAEGSGTAAANREKDSFKVEPIPEDIKDKMIGNSYNEAAQIPFGELSYVQVLYYGFDGKVYNGELVVNEIVSQDIVEIFKTLYTEKFPINKVALIDAYNGDDGASMADNNSSAFCWREIAGGGRLSMHAYGLAVDINPVINPYVQMGPDGAQTIKPPQGAAYLDRTVVVPGTVTKGDACYNAFISHGWSWGGDWTSLKDYQHFYKNVEGYPQE